MRMIEKAIEQKNTKKKVEYNFVQMYECIKV